MFQILESVRTNHAVGHDDQPREIYLGKYPTREEAESAAVDLMLAQHDEFDAYCHNNRGQEPTYVSTWDVVAA